MTSKEKKDIILQDVFKTEFKKAGYRTSGTKFFYVNREGCSLKINIASSRFNSAGLGLTFGLEIYLLPADTPVRTFKFMHFDFPNISEYLLLPDCGFLHPYRRGLDYCIDGYKNYQQMDMDLEDMKNRMRDDLQHYILPQLGEIHSYSDWERKAQEWENLDSSPRVLLLRYFDSAQSLAVCESSIKNLKEMRKVIGITPEEIIENEALYHQIRSFSSWPETDKWDFILDTL